MSAYLAIAPGSWGVEPPGDPTSPPWGGVLDEIHQAGYRFAELGPLGYLPEDGDVLKAELRARDLELVAGYAMEPFHFRRSREATLKIVERTCRVLTGGGAKRLVLIEALTPQRSQTAGRDHDAVRLDRRDWEVLVNTIEAAAEIAASFGMSVTFHPHAGTAVEFRDEVDSLMDALEPAGVGLCVDSGHSVIAGIDPVDLIEAYASRVEHVHLKDVDREKLAEMRERRASFEQGVECGVFCPLGSGMVNFAALAATLRSIDFEGYATVEQDRFAGDPAALSDARESLRFAQGVGFEVGRGVAQDGPPPRRSR
jgi:inosose dehydratase